MVNYILNLGKELRILVASKSESLRTLVTRKLRTSIEFVDLLSAVAGLWLVLIASLLYSHLLNMGVSFRKYNLLSMLTYPN